MSRVFGNIEQLGIVVHDIDRTMIEWADRLGVGPFFVMRNCVFDNFQYCGKPSPSPILTIACAQSGNLQVELIQQHNHVPSAYRDFLAAGHEGAQHVSSWFATGEAYDEMRANLVRRGLSLTHEGAVAGGIARFAYFATDLPGAMSIEISEGRVPAIRPIMAQIEDAAKDWDGSNPIRGFSSA